MNVLNPNLFAFETHCLIEQPFPARQTNTPLAQEVLDDIHAHQKWQEDLADAKIAVKIWSILHRLLKWEIFKGLVDKAQQRLTRIQQQLDQPSHDGDYNQLISYLATTSQEEMSSHDLLG